MRIIVGITGASGSLYGIRLLERLQEAGAETALVMSRWGQETIRMETDYSVEQVQALAHATYDNQDLAAAISSGSYPADGMVVAPCSMKTLAGIAHAHDNTLVVRAADVSLKERRRLVLLVRETPLNLAHIENMRQVVLGGGVVMPPVPAFYTRPQTVDDIVDHTVGRVLDLFGIVPPKAIHRWEGRHG